MQLIDTHCHLDFPEFNLDRESVIKRANENDVSLIIDVGSSLAGSRFAVTLAKEHGSIYAAVGIHPHEADKITDKDFLEIESLAKENKVVAIGETGLDYFRNLSSRSGQQQAFERFIELAGKLNLPLIIHCREAQEDCFSALTSAKRKLKVLMHCFSGNENFLRRCLDSGFIVSFTCNITYKKAFDLREIVKIVPLDRFLLETDAPFLPPENLRGKRNEPMHIKSLAQQISVIKGLDLEAIAKATSENAKEFFNLP